MLQHRSRFLAASVLATCLAAVVGCSSGADSSSASVESEEDALTTSAQSEWFYNGPLPMLDAAKVTISLKGKTARVTGLLPAGTKLDEVLPHVMTKEENGRTRIDAVYPIATARVAQGKSNSRVGSYRFNDVIPFRSDGIAVTEDEGPHFVTWGGFPFMRYNRGIALHGPITSAGSKVGGRNVWYLQRGEVSGGCNRMMGEHVVELAHITGLDMRKVYRDGGHVEPPRPATVNVIADYDTYEGKFIDSDYATDANTPAGTKAMVRPAKIHGVENVAMFGSWVASEMPDGSDLPRDFKFQGGVNGQLYVFMEHAKNNWVCRVAPKDLGRLRTYAAANGGRLPQTFCANKACVLSSLASGGNPNDDCPL